MKIVFVEADKPTERNCSIWLCENPARALASLPGVTASVVSLDDFAKARTQEVCEVADLIVVERNLFGDTLSAIGYWRAAGKPVVTIFDDALHLIPSTNPSYRFWQLGQVKDEAGGSRTLPGLPPLLQFEQGLRQCVAAVMPSRLLADEWKIYLPTHYLPNYPDTQPYLAAAQPPKAAETIVIGWGGGASHLQSFTGSGVIPALVEVCRQRPQVRVVICSGDQRVFNHLPLEASRKELRSWVPAAEWPRQMADFNLGLAPLAGLFDDHRSWNKPLEYMLMNIPWLGSLSPAYADLSQFGNLVVNTPEAWTAALLERIDHLADYQVQAREISAFALAQDLFANAQAILKVYKEIIAHAV